MEVFLQSSVLCAWVFGWPYLWFGLDQCIFGVFGLAFFLSFTRMFERQSVGCVTGFMMPSLQSLSNSSFTLSSLATGTRRSGEYTGLTLGSSSMCMGVPRGFPRLGLYTFK